MPCDYILYLYNIINNQYIKKYTKQIIMTVSESREKLRDRYVKWYVTKYPVYNTTKQMTDDAKYSWWEREKDCQQWCDKEGSYVPMSETKTLNIMRQWFKECKNR